VPFREAERERHPGIRGIFLISTISRGLSFPLRGTPGKSTLVLLQSTWSPAPSQARSASLPVKLSAHTAPSSGPHIPLPGAKASNPGKGGGTGLQNNVTPACRMVDTGETQRRELEAGLSGLRALGRRPPAKWGQKKCGRAVSHAPVRELAPSTLKSVRNRRWVSTGSS